MTPKRSGFFLYELTIKDMKVKYIPGFKGVSKHNILWEGNYSMKAGRFPADHPFSDNPEPFTFLGNVTMEGAGDRLTNFRKAGYFASCFPEGDGLCFTPLGDQSVDQIRQDIIEHLKVELKP